MSGGAGMISAGGVGRPQVGEIDGNPYVDTAALKLKASSAAGGGFGGALMGGFLGAGEEAVSQGAEQMKRNREREETVWRAEHDEKLEMKKRALILQDRAHNESRQDELEARRRGEQEQSKSSEKKAKQHYANFAQVYRKNPELVQDIANIAEEEGIPATTLLATWGKESSFSTNTKLHGDELSKGRGRAVGPFQIVKYYHPEFDESMGILDQARIAARIIREQGVDGYYGKGKAPAGHPTTSQYVADHATIEESVAAVLSGGSSKKSGGLMDGGKAGLASSVTEAPPQKEAEAPQQDKGVPDKAVTDADGEAVHNRNIQSLIETIKGFRARGIGRFAKMSDSQVALEAGLAYGNAREKFKGKIEK